MLLDVARPPKEIATPSPLAPALLRLVAARGLDAPLLATRCGLEAGDADVDEVATTPSALAALLASTCDLLADPHAALRFPAELPMRRYDGLALALRAARTPRDVPQQGARYAPLVFPHLELTVRDEADALSVAARIAGHPRGLGLPVDELLLSLLLGHCRRGGGDVVPLRAWLASARPRTLEPLFALLGTSEIAFGEESTGFALSSATASQELAGADPLMVATAEAMATPDLARAPRASSLVPLVAARIENALETDASTEAIAKALGMSPRTLQRRLEDEGTRYSAVLEATRERIARRLLGAPDLPLAEVARRTGFADLASFSRAFKHWTGMPPGAFRRR